MKIYFRITVILAALLAVSCAKRNDADDIHGDELETVKAWMKLNVPNAVELTEGVWYEWLERGPEESEGGRVRPENGDHIMLDYTGYPLLNYDPVRHKGNIFMTRDEATAKLAGSFNVYTYYAPLLLNYVTNNSGLFGGQVAAIEDLGMRVGDHIRLYMSAGMSLTAPALTYNYGYGGNVSFSASYPKVVTMKLTGLVTKNIKDYERDIVTDFISNDWGVEPEEARLIDRTPNAGEDGYKDIYINIEENDVAQPKIKMDSTIRIRYTGYFIDKGTRGFVFDTNVPEIGHALERDTLLYSALSFNASTMSEKYISAFTKMVEADTLHYGSKCSLVFISDWGYPGGRNGNATSTYIQYNTPLLFDIYIEPYKEK